jgi:enoyl-[acyl-carrier protein] reductase I
MTYALVIGGSQGLGLATVEKLLVEGVPVIAIHRDFKKDLPGVQQAFRKFKAQSTPFHAIHMDAIRKTDRIVDSIKDLIGKKGKIRILVHSIARGNLKPMSAGSDKSTLSEEDFAVTGQAMAINLYTWVHTLEKEGLFAADSRIIAFTSEGNKRVIPGYGAVAAAKASLESIVRQIAVEFAHRGIRANCIQAGVTDTASLRRIPDSSRLLGASVERNPFRRLTQPSDVAILKVDGGESLC